MPSLRDRIQKDKIPNHIAIIMDGNGRWAKARSMTRLFGHHNGVKSVREVTESCARLGVKYLTLYTFSTENWSRPQEEVSGLMNLLIQTVGKELDTLLKNNIRLQIIGDLSHLPGSTQNALRQAMEKTRDNQRMTLVLAINYSGRQEILNAITRITEEVRNGQLTWHEDEHLFSKYLFTGDIPDPELLIRTSGERRISNFLLWQCAYSEFYFTDVLWPEFREEHLYQAILDYQSRERRFGLITEQLADKR
ncbi:MAG: isoprenyl transferase [Saprospiraceae bacterium]